MKAQAIKYRVLLIGGMGFIGSHLQKRFKNENDLITLSVDKNIADFEKTESSYVLRDLIEDWEPTTIVILAAVKRQDGDEKSVFDSNNRITNNIINGIKEFNNQVIYISSCAVYGEKNEQIRINEAHPFNPTSNYGTHKVLSEEAYSAAFSIKNNLLILRPPLVYSEFEKTGYGPGGFINQAIERKEIQLWGNGDELREFIHVDDIANVIALLVKKNSAGIVNLVSGKSFSYRQIVEQVRKYIDFNIFEKIRTNQKVNHTYDAAEMDSLVDKHVFRTPLESVDNYFNK